jgi:hypothetical protein
MIDGSSNTLKEKNLFVPVNGCFIHVPARKDQKIYAVFQTCGCDETCYLGLLLKLPLKISGQNVKYLTPLNSECIVQTRLQNS